MSPGILPEGASAAQLAQLLSEESLGAVIAPHLPLLMMPGYTHSHHYPEPGPQPYIPNPALSHSPDLSSSLSPNPSPSREPNPNLSLHL